MEGTIALACKKTAKHQGKYFDNSLNKFDFFTGFLCRIETNYRDETGRLSSIQENWHGPD